MALPFVFSKTSTALIVCVRGFSPFSLFYTFFLCLFFPTLAETRFTYHWASLEQTVCCTLFMSQDCRLRLAFEFISNHMERKQKRKLLFLILTAHDSLFFWELPKVKRLFIHSHFSIQTLFCLFFQLIEIHYYFASAAPQSTFFYLKNYFDLPLLLITFISFTFIFTAVH